MIIQDKIAPVDDTVCKRCDQLWDGLCRAFRPPHSVEERRQRMSNIILCEQEVADSGEMLNRHVRLFSKDGVLVGRTG